MKFSESEDEEMAEKKEISPTEFTGKPSDDPCTLPNCESDKQEGDYQTLFVVFRNPQFKAVVCRTCFFQLLEHRDGNGKPETKNRALSDNG